MNAQKRSKIIAIVIWSYVFIVSFFVLQALSVLVRAPTKPTDSSIPLVSVTELIRVKKILSDRLPELASPSALPSDFGKPEPFKK